MRVWKKIPNCWRCDFFDSAQTRIASSENGFVYDECASGPTYYNWMRFYDPWSGRYITEDPIGLWGGLNEYAYGDDDPVGNHDVYGLMGHGSGAVGPRPLSPKVKPANPCKIDLKKLVKNAQNSAKDPDTGITRTSGGGDCALTTKNNLYGAGGPWLPSLGDREKDKDGKISGPGGTPSPGKWGKTLTDSGCYREVADPSKYKWQPGDIAITPALMTGHASIYTGESWNADIATNDPVPSTNKNHIPQGKYKGAHATIYQYIGVNNLND